MLLRFAINSLDSWNTLNEIMNRKPINCNNINFLTVCCMIDWLLLAYMNFSFYCQSVCAVWLICCFIVLSLHTQTHVHHIIKFVKPVSWLQFDLKAKPIWNVHTHQYEPIERTKQPSDLHKFTIRPSQNKTTSHCKSDCKYRGI